MQKEGLAALKVCQSIRQFSAIRPHPSERDRTLSHATRGCDGRQEGRESGYYNLHRYLNNAIRLHTHQTLRFAVLVEVIATVTPAASVATTGVTASVSTSAITT